MNTRTGSHTLIPLLYLMPLIILLEGFASIGIEILTIRQLLPVAGGSVIVTSLIIGVFLLFLAMGYEKGGRVAENLHAALRRNFFMVSVWVGIGLSYVFISVFFQWVSGMAGQHVVYPLLGYLFVILAPAIYLLGQTLPITMNIAKQDKRAGAIAGKTLGLSTIGSFFGAVLTTLVLMHYAGVAWTVFIIFSSLMVLSLLLSQSWQHMVVMSLLGVAAAYLVYLANVDIENNRFIRTNNYANYQIIDINGENIAPGAKTLLINETFSSYTDDYHRAYPYIEAIRKLIFTDLKLQNADILVLGAGGFTLSDVSNNTNHFTYVDIDKQIKNVVEPAFLEKVRETLVADDARSFLNATKKRYAVIVIDAYSDYKSVPAHLLTREFMLQVKSHLQPDGRAIFNIISNPTFKDPYSRRIDNTIRSAFGSCAAIPTDYFDGLANIIYVCDNRSKVEDRTVYSDNLNNSTTDSFSW